MFSKISNRFDGEKIFFSGKEKLNLFSKIRSFIKWKKTTIFKFLAHCEQGQHQQQQQPLPSKPKRSKDKKAHKDKHSKTANSKSSDAKKGMGDFKSRLVY